LSLTAVERETIITLNDEDETAEIWTAQRPWITKLRKNPSAVLLEEGKHDGSVWARFQIDKSLISVRAQSRKGQRAGQGKGQTPPAFLRPTTGAISRVSEQDDEEVATA
jgi:hypothetical protein